MPRPGWYHADGDPPHTVRFWNGQEWEGEPRPAPSEPFHAPPPTGAPLMGRERFGGVWRRVFATLIDGILQALLVMPVLLAVGFDDTNSSTLQTTGILMTLVFFLLATWFVAVYGGTPGKLVLGLRVTQSDAETTPPGWDAALKRTAVNLVGVLPLVGSLLGLTVGILNLVWVAQDPERRSVHDKVGGTRVVHAAALPPSARGRSAT